MSVAEQEVRVPIRGVQANGAGEVGPGLGIATGPQLEESNVSMEDTEVCVGIDGYQPPQSLHGGVDVPLPELRLRELAIYLNGKWSQNQRLTEQVSCLARSPLNLENHPLGVEAGSLLFAVQFREHVLGSPAQRQRGEHARDDEGVT